MYQESKEIFLRLRVALIILGCVLILGTVGFYILENGQRTLLDCFYFILVTITTVGYGDITPTTVLAKLWTIFIILLGVGVTVTTIPLIFESIIGRKIREVLKVPKEEIKKDHYIVCGYGKVGRLLVKRLQQKGTDFVVIEHGIDRVKELVEHNISAVEGDARREDILERAGIKTAKYLLTCLEDADNVFIIITAKMLNPTLKVITKVEDESNEPKLKKAGADAVVSCHDKGAQMMLELVAGD